jgi:predicted AAA+ superfamily ATPase
MFDFSLKKQIRNPKKIYSIDTGQVNAVAFHFTENLGRLLENLVFLELRRSGLELYYYKTQNNLEVDFLAKKHTRIALIQVALHVMHSKTFSRELNALTQGLNELKLSHGIMITQDHEELLVEDNKNITVIPAYKFFCLTSDEKMKLLQLG